MNTLRATSRLHSTAWRPPLPYGYSYEATLPYWIKPSFVIFDIRALWRSALSVRCPDVKNCKWRLNPVWHRMLYSWTHMATVGVKGLRVIYSCSVLHWEVPVFKRGPGRPRANWRSAVNKDMSRKGITWEEAEVAAQNRSEWRSGSVAQCIHLDAGWIKVKVKCWDAGTVWDWKARSMKNNTWWLIIASRLSSVFSALILPCWVTNSTPPTLHEQTTAQHTGYHSGTRHFWGISSESRKSPPPKKN